MALVVKRTWADEDLSPTRSQVSRCYKASEVALTTNDLLPRARSTVPFSLGPSVNLERQEKRHFLKKLLLKVLQKWHNLDSQKENG